MMFFAQAGFALLILETLVFWAVAGKIGFLSALGLWVLSALAGTYLVRAQGLSTLSKITSAGRVDAEQLYDSACLLFAGFLFIFPGFISDALAFALIIPMVRNSFRERGLKLFKAGPSPRPSPAAEDGVIEGTYEVVDDPAAPGSKTLR